jgi:DNA-binding transcriptional LysR family regulator
VRLELHVADARSVLEQIVSHELELGVVDGEWSASGLAFEPVWTDRFVLVAGSTGPYADAEASTLQARGAVPFLAPEPGTGDRTTLERELRRRSVDLAEFADVVDLGSQASVAAAVAAGWGIGGVWADSVRAELGSGQLRVLDVPGGELDSDYLAVRRASRRLSRRGQALLQFLRDSRAHVRS